MDMDVQSREHRAPSTEHSRLGRKAGWLVMIGDDW